LAYSARELAQSAKRGITLQPAFADRTEIVMDSWSTDTVNERECFSYWREMICSTVMTISPDAPGDRFSARLTTRTSGPLRFATCESTSYENVRTQRDISRAPADHYTVYLQMRGQTLMSQGDESFAFGQNDIFISDGRKPFRAALSENGYRAMMIIPRAMVDWRAPWLRRRTLARVDANSQFLDFARRHFVHLVSDDLNDTETDLLTDNLCNLLALASAGDIEPNRMRPELQIQAMVTFCKQNLHRSDLSPQMVAACCGISVRTLHSRFATLGQTFGNWLLTTRLDACHKALRDPSQQARSISEIAYGYGFNNLSHFNKTFRTRFDMSPGEWRHDFE
jgi:AraC family transcriptional regulator, positive regulator of tynA and feaB